MVQSLSWEANWFAASQEIPHISRNPKVHYRTHKCPPPVSIMGQPNSVHIPTSHFLEIHPNIIHPSMSRSPQWSPSFRFPHQDTIHPHSSPTRATCPARLIILDFNTRTILGEEYSNLSNTIHYFATSSWKRKNCNSYTRTKKKESGFRRINHPKLVIRCGLHFPLHIHMGFGIERKRKHVFLLHVT